MNVGFIGFGEAAYYISMGLKDEGVSGIVAYDAMLEHPVAGKKIKQRAQDSRVKLLVSPADTVDTTDFLFVAVPAVNAQDVCNEITPFLKPGQLYIDVSASTPKVKESFEKMVEKSGALYVDAAMLGSLPLNRHKVPITASGSGAEKFKETMSKKGMNITCVGSQAGSASAIKLIRSVFMKGIAALMLEMLEGAYKYNVMDEVVSSLSASMDGISFESHLKRLITGTAVHAKRRAEELNGSVQMLMDRDVDNAMVKASKYKHEYLAECLSGEQAKDEYEDIHSVLVSMRKNQ